MTIRKDLLVAVAALAMLTAGCATQGATDMPQTTPQSMSGLATPEQIAFERQILRVLESPAMKAEIARVEQLYAADPQGATPTGKATIARGAHSIAVAATQYAVGEDPDRPAAFWVINAPHEWSGLSFPRSGYGIDNPNNVYRNVMLSGTARYEIHGRVSPPGPVEQHFEIRESIPGTTPLNEEAGQQVATLSDAQISYAADGSFVISIDSSPADGRANHMQIPEKGTFLLIVRDLFTDWSSQNPVALDVRRIGGPPVSPPRSEDEVVARSVSLLSQIAPFWLGYFNAYVYSGKANEVSGVRVRPGGRGMSSAGHFLLKDDEALVMTLDPLGAKSMDVQLTDPWGVSYEYRNRTSSLNNAQALPNPDGTITFVISRTDPGVRNWLDPEGHAAGMFAVRWQGLQQQPRTDLAIRKAEVVRLERLKSLLPGSTGWVSQADRQKLLAERARGHARRLGD